MSHIILPVDTNVTLFVNDQALIDDTDFKTREESVVYNQAGLDLLWNFITLTGTISQTAVTPTDTGGDYDWTNVGNAMYKIELPASGAGAKNDTEGFGFFTGFATGILPWKSFVYGFVPQQAIDAFSLATNPLATKMIRLLAAIVRKDADAAADLATEIGELNTDFGSGPGAYDNEASAMEYLATQADAIKAVADGVDANLDGLVTIVGSPAAPTAIPAYTGSLSAIVSYLLAKTFHKATFDKGSGVWTLYENDGVTPLADRTDSVVGDVYTKEADTNP